MLDATHKTDAQIQHDVVSDLRWDSRGDETDVGVTVRGGIVTLQPQVAPHALRASIQAALERQVQREAQRIQLDIVDGKVTVTGAVRSRAEHDADRRGMGNAWGPGRHRPGSRRSRCCGLVWLPRHGQ